MTRTQDVRKLVFNGILAAKELQDLAKTVDTQGVDLVSVTSLSESTDPSWYSPELVASARHMARAYFRLYLFENRARQLIEKVLRAEHSDKWLEVGVPDEIRQRAERVRESEGAAKFHGQRGDNLLNYVGLPDLSQIVIHNWTLFGEIMYRQDWVKAKFEDLRLTRNAIAHMGVIGPEDFTRLDVILADWNRQVS